MPFAGFMLLLLAAWGFYAAFRPRRAWRAAEGWAYANPDAVEPSDAALAIRSVASFVGSVILLVSGFYLLFTPSPQERAEAEEAARSECREVLRELADVAEFDSYRLTNSSKVRATANALGVEIKIEHNSTPIYGMESSGTVYSWVFLLDADGRSIGSLSSLRGVSC